MRTLRLGTACPCCLRVAHSKWKRAAIVHDERLTEEDDMLVLSRKKDEKIVIGDNITLMVIEIRGDKVRLGIDAPRDVAVHREEVYDAIKRETGQTQAD
jgi:carbon storage regulator